MTNRTKLAGAALAMALTVAGAAAAAAENPARDPKATDEQPLVQIALLLDTSNSMDGLIAQAKTQLWKVVNEFARARRNGKAPRLEVALYEYGNDGLPAATGFIRQVVPLTTDLDRISEHLFALRTNGGSEFCGQVIQVATRDLAWSRDRSALKLVFIAGNEEFTQGQVNYADAVKAAIKQGIVVNTIFCGGEAEGVNGKWRDGAVLADGRYAFIDSNQQVAVVQAPQDAELAKLGAEMNRTYVAYGAEGKKKAERQAIQDSNAASAGQGAAVTRAAAKASIHYKNSDWDLVDAAKDGKVAVGSVAAEALPEEMRGMNEKQRKEYVDQMAKKREEIRARINQLESERRAYVAAEEKKSAAKGASTFDKAVLGAVHEQAERAAFSFE